MNYTSCCSSRKWYVKLPYVLQNLLRRIVYHYRAVLDTFAIDLLTVSEFYSNLINIIYVMYGHAYLKRNMSIIKFRLHVVLQNDVAYVCF